MKTVPQATILNPSTMDEEILFTTTPIKDNVTKAIIGTGFFYVSESKLFLVTAKHVLQDDYLNPLVNFQIEFHTSEGGTTDITLTDPTVTIPNDKLDLCAVTISYIPQNALFAPSLNTT